jgi:CubicO group peptidase (beta-lactamase class C family)
METATGQSLETLVQDLVFAPLGMTSSNYVNAKELRPALAYGHCNLGAFLAPVMQVFAAILVVAILVVVAVQRLRRGRWCLSWRMAAVAYTLAVLAGIALGDLVAGPGARKWTLLTGLWLAGLGVALGSLGLAARWVARRLPYRQQNPARQEGAVGFALVVGAVVVIWLSFHLTVPVPRGPAVPPNAAYSLRATADDLARFLIELSDPQLLPAPLGDEMRTAQVRVNADNSWGLGLAIQHSAQGDALWHGGSNRDFQCHMVVYPNWGWGAVVLTNGEMGGPVARDVVARALGGKAHWSLARQP